MKKLKPKILFVDPKYSEFLRSAVSIFDEAGFKVDFCFHWDSLLQKLKDSVRAIDFLIIDLACFQTRNAYFSLVELRERKFAKDQKIILTTNTLVEEILRQKRRELGIVATFNKTRNVEELLYVLTNISYETGENLRQTRRIPAQFLVDYTVKDQTQVLWARNLSRGGIFVQNQTPDPVGTHAHLSFTLPGGKSRLLATARVVRATSGSHIIKQEVFPPGNGLAFTELSPAAARLLTEYTDSEESRIFGDDNGANQSMALEEQVAAAELPQVDKRPEGQCISGRTPNHQMK